MNRFHLKEIYIDGTPADQRLIQTNEAYMLSRKDIFEVHLYRKERMIFYTKLMMGWNSTKSSCRSRKRSSAFSGLHGTALLMSV